MDDRALITAGVAGAALSALCCATPLLAVVLAVVLGALGLTAWLAKADYVLVPTLVLCLVLIGFGLYRGCFRRG